MNVHVSAVNFVRALLEKGFRISVSNDEVIYYWTTNYLHTKTRESIAEIGISIKGVCTNWRNDWSYVAWNPSYFRSPWLICERFKKNRALIKWQTVTKQSSQFSLPVVLLFKCKNMKSDRWALSPCKGRSLVNVFFSTTSSRYITTRFHSESFDTHRHHH